MFVILRITNKDKNMRNKLVLAMFSILLLACSGKTNAEGNNQPPTQGDYVEVLYFHGKQRCATCLAIEKETNAVVNEIFSKELQDGSIVLKTIDISKKENEAIAERYEVAWSSLLIVSHKNGNEKVQNITDFAFSYARSNPDSFKEGLERTIKKALE